MNKKILRFNGFTYVELILYVGIIALIVPAMMLFGWNLLYGRIRARTQQELNQNLRLAADRISFEIRNGKTINSVSASSISLGASQSARSPLVIDLSSGRIRLGSGSSGSCTSAAPCNLTSNRLNISGLSFTNLSSGGSKHIRFTITAVSTSDRAEYQYSQTYTGSAELNSN